MQGESGFLGDCLKGRRVLHFLHGENVGVEPFDDPDDGLNVSFRFRPIGLACLMSREPVEVPAGDLDGLLLGIRLVLSGIGGLGVMPVVWLVWPAGAKEADEKE